MSNQTWAQQVAAWNAEQNRRAAEDRQGQQAEAQWEQQCLQADRQDALDEARNAIDYITQERDLALQNEDFEEARARQSELRAKVAEYNHIAGPPPPPPLSAAKQEWVRKVQPFLRQHGEAGARALDIAHQRAIAAKHREDSQEYFDHMRSDLELNGHHVGTPARPEDLSGLTPREAARISGLRPEEYDRWAAHLAKLKREGDTDELASQKGRCRFRAQAPERGRRTALG